MSLSNKSTEQLFREGIAAARNQDKATARDCFHAIIRRDDHNEKAWLWLASVLSDADERRAAFEKVLQLNPENQAAKRELAALTTASAAQKSVAINDREGLFEDDAKTARAAAGRRRSLLLLVALIVVLLLVLVAVFALRGGGSPASAVTPGSTQIAAAGTTAATTAATMAATVNSSSTTSVPVAQVSTSAATGAPATVASGGSVATTTVSTSAPVVIAANNTLPPSWTPAPSLTPLLASSSTPLAPAPSGLTGRLLVATGTIVDTNDNFLPIVSMKPDGSDSQPIVSDPDRGDYAIYTPDGKAAIYVYATSGSGSKVLRIANRDGSKPRLLSAAWGNLPPLDIRSSLSLSANGRYLAFSGLSILQTEADPAIYVLDLQTFLSDKLSITPTNAPHPTKTPTMVPNTTAVKPPTLADLYLTRMTVRNSGQNLWPALSPDGRTLVYVNQSPDSAQPVVELYAVPFNPPGSSAQPPTTAAIAASGASANGAVALTNDGSIVIKSAPEWSPDGKYIAFTSGPVNNSYSDLEVMLADGSGRHVLLHQDNVHNVRPHWSPDGKYLAFSSDRSHAMEVYIVNIATTVAYQVTNNGKTNYVTSWAAN